jgi:4-oxalocrotonate tautomerase
MPIIHVNVWENFGEERVRKVIEGVTKVFVDLNIPEYAVEVIVHEVPKTNWGIGGEPASVKFKDPQDGENSA